MRKIYRLVLATVFIITSLACDLSGDGTSTETLIPTGPPPTMPPVHNLEVPTHKKVSQTVLHVDLFSAGSGEWFAGSESPSEVKLDTSEGMLVADINSAVNSVNFLARSTTNLPAQVDGFTIYITAEGRPFSMVVGAKEADGSWYHTFLHLDPSEGIRTVEVAFDWLILDQNSKDENDTLDLEQISEVNLVDISGFVGPIGVGTIKIESVIFWQGDSSVSSFRCSSSESSKGEFLAGVDANYIPEGEAKGEKWYSGGSLVDPLALIAAQGAQSLRLRVWVGDDGPSRLSYATQLAQRAHDVGLQIYPVLFLTNDWADINKQPTPPEWADLLLDERADVIRAYSRDAITQLLETGITPPYYEIGNEIDFGISGVFAELEQRDLETLQTTIWPEEALLLQAAIEGVRQADPQARVMLHIAQGFAPTFSVAFFTSMRDLGVDYDLAGLSFYPSALGPLIVDGFCRSLDRLKSELELPVVISEFAYPAEPPTGGLFASWGNALPAYPLSPEGQASYFAHFLADMRAHPNVIAVYYFSPTFHWSGELWGPFALFDADGNARPALGAFTML